MLGAAAGLETETQNDACHLFVLSSTGWKLIILIQKIRIPTRVSHSFHSIRFAMKSPKPMSTLPE